MDMYSTVYGTGHLKDEIIVYMQFIFWDSSFVFSNCQPAFFQSFEVILNIKLTHRKLNLRPVRRVVRTAASAQYCGTSKYCLATISTTQQSLLLVQ